MADSAQSAGLPASLDSLYRDSASSPGSATRYDAVQLSETECLSVLRLPLARKVLGHEPLSGVEEGTKNGAGTSNGDADGSSSSFISQVESRVEAIIKQDNKAGDAFDPRSQLVHIGLAALSIFLQLNVTGPPLSLTSKESAELAIPTSVLSGENNALFTLRQQMVRSLTVDGETIYPLTPNVELFCAAKAILNCKELLQNTRFGEEPPLFARTARMRVNFLHQKMLGENAEALQNLVYEDLELIGKKVVDSDAPREDKSRFLLERATVHTHHGFDAKARADLERAAQETGFEYALTGRLGKRTKFQDRDISQLVVLAKSADEDVSKSSGSEQPKETEQTKPTALDLNDDTLLESISFTKKEPPQERAMTLQDESSLSPGLAAIDPSQQPKLKPLDSVILLSIASAITNTSPEHGLTREETLPYATRVLDGGSSNWQIYTQALLLRSRIEGYKSRTIERGVLQLQALVDQVIADTATDSETAVTGTEQQPTTFLPRPDVSESASASERLQYIWLLNFSTRWNLESELASRWVNLGALRTALDIYERLQLWAEVALCYAATDREDQAKEIVKKQLYASDDPQKELETLPTDAPRLFCILGDIDTDPAMYERAWSVSNGRYARAQRSLARHYLGLKPPQFKEAEEAFQKSLAINRLNHSTWFSLGCVQLELEKDSEAVESFTRCVQLEESDAESWSNLAVALLRAPPTEAPKVEDDSQPSVEPPNPHKAKFDALMALQRAAKLKHTDHRIWDNVLTVSASIPPPDTPFRDIIYAQTRLIELRGSKQGEKCIDLSILSALTNHLITTFDFESELQPDVSPPTLRRGTFPSQLLNLLDTSVIPLITHSAPLWLLVARAERWRNRPLRALEAHEKAWRATLTKCAQPAFQMGEEPRWMDIVSATEMVVRDGYARLGGLEREGGSAGADGEGELVAKDWRFKARSAVRGVLGKGKELWEDTEGWARLKELAGEVSGGNS
ncbi:hypothetical protein FQN54_005262 [Arachnomyces sp. PD_36]|nr:hypothetical protein FQN54_005262 [Arachnomyces sp. PD_36]